MTLAAAPLLFYAFRTIQLGAVQFMIGNVQATKGHKWA